MRTHFVFVEPKAAQALASTSLCPSRPNTGDRLRSGARVLPRRRGHEAACPIRQPCRRKLRQLHPFVRLRRDSSPQRRRQQTTRPSLVGRCQIVRPIHVRTVPTPPRRAWHGASFRCEASMAAPLKEDGLLDGFRDDAPRRGAHRHRRSEPVWPVEQLWDARAHRGPERRVSHAREEKWCGAACSSVTELARRVQARGGRRFVVPPHKEESNTGDKLRRARPSMAPHRSSDTVATAAYHASLQLQPPFVGFIPLFCRRGHTPHMSSTACSNCARSYA